ncbi:MAG TPA: PVC-type heme-binding CxxCH protein [Opitutaceae bacterium]
MHTKPGLVVDLVAAEPLVIDPIAIEFGTDGRLWVVEMRDYPMGIDGHWNPGGVIKVLADTDSDGRFDRATVFMDRLPFPTGVMPWRKGALICVAPDILYAEDTDGDGRADVVRTVLTGFPTDNYQARVNGLALGLDNWVYGANTMSGGTIKGLNRALEPVEIRSNDFRFQPDTGVVEAASGRTQFGRGRDDWDNWFGCHNSNPVLHFPMPEQYARRNPHVAMPPSTVFLPDDRAQNRVFPLAEPVRRFNHPGQLNYITAGCGLGIYRDTLLGGEFEGNVFVCESVHAVVTRLQLFPRGATFDASRADD